MQIGGRASPVREVAPLPVAWCAAIAPGRTCPAPGVIHYVRRAVPSFRDRCHVGAISLARVPFSLVRDTETGHMEILWRITGVPARSVHLAYLTRHDRSVGWVASEREASFGVARFGELEG